MFKTGLDDVITSRLRELFLEIRVFFVCSALYYSVFHCKCEYGLFVLGVFTLVRFGSIKTNSGVIALLVWFI